MSPVTDGKPSLSQRAYEHLRDRIVQGELRPGDRVSLRSAAKSLGMSMAPVGEALRELASRAGVELESYAQRDTSAAAAEERAFTLLDMAAEFFQDALPHSPVEAYLVSRGITPDTAFAFRLGYAPDSWSALLDHLTLLGFSVDEVVDSGVAIRNETGRVYDRFRHRLVIPIRDEKGRVLGFGARALEPDQEPKYINSPQGALFDKSRILYGFDLARRSIREQETAVVVEGYMDAIQAHQSGYSNVVAQMGTALTTEQLQTISKYARKLILALDTDAAGIKATMRGLETARETLGDGQTLVLDARGMMRQAGRLNIDIRVITLPHGKDPDDFLRATPEAWPDQIAAALPLAEYIIKVGTADLPRSASVAEREALAQELLPLLTATEDDIQRLNNVQLLSHRLRLDPKTMVAWAVSKSQRVKTGSSTKPPRGPFGGRDRFNDRPQVQAPPPPPVRFSLAAGKRAVEKHCLASLLRSPERFFEANRLLRQIQSDLEGVDIAPLQAADFSQGDFQAIFNLFVDACQQDEIDPFDYLVEYADETLRHVIDEIVQEPVDLFLEKLEQSLKRDWPAIWAELARRIEAPRDDLSLQLLTLRWDRLQQEGNEMSYLQKEARDSGDLDLELRYAERFHALKQVMRVLDAAINKKESRGVQ